MNGIALVPSCENLPTPLVDLASAARGYMEESLAAATRKAYASDFRIFVTWCKARGYAPTPATPELVALFLTDQARAGICASTLTRRVAAIRFAHEGANQTSPTTSKLVGSALKGIRRSLGMAKDQKTPATAHLIGNMVAHCPGSLIGLRDRALLLLGFAGAFRRSELATLTVADLSEVPEGLRVTIRKSKTDQEGSGQMIPIYNGMRLGAVTAVKTWLTAAAITKGPIFRSINKGGRVSDLALTDRSIANTVKHYAALAGLHAEDFSGHSLRSGFLTSAAEHGADIFKMMEVSRHKRVETVRGYVRMAEQFKNHAGAGFL